MDRRAKRFWFPWAALMTLAMVCMLMGADGGLAGAQSASQPVIVNVVDAKSGWEWFLANSTWIVPLAISLLSSIATGLSDYPKAGGIVRGLRIAIAVLGVVQFRDGKGSIKAPLAPPAKP